MSLFSSIGKVAKKVLPKAAPVIGSVAGMVYGGPAGAALGGRIGSAFGAVKSGASVRPGAGFVAGGAMGSLPPLVRGVGMAGSRAGAIAGAAAGYAVRGARAAAASASYYCRKYPTWCSTIGGLAAVEALVGNGQLPPIKRRRRKGLTPRDLASFRRVASLIKTYGPAARRVPSNCAPRKSCKSR